MCAAAPRRNAPPRGAERRRRLGRHGRLPAGAVAVGGRCACCVTQWGPGCTWTERRGVPRIVVPPAAFFRSGLRHCMDAGASGEPDCECRACCRLGGTRTDSDAGWADGSRTGGRATPDSGRRGPARAGACRQRAGRIGAGAGPGQSRSGDRSRRGREPELQARGARGGRSLARVSDSVQRRRRRILPESSPPSRSVRDSDPLHVRHTVRCRGAQTRSDYAVAVTVSAVTVAA